MTTQILEVFGQHLMMEGYGCPEDKLKDINLIYDCLDKLPEIVDMTKIIPPYVFKYSGKVPEDWGLTGFVLIAESHISIHTFPNKGFLTLDIFSCKQFDSDIAVNEIIELFEVKKYAVEIKDRGLEFPRSIPVVKEHLIGERNSLKGDEYASL